MKPLTFIIAGLLVIFVFTRSDTSFQRNEKLSDYGFFKGKLADLDPVEGVTPYSVNTALFSNYAEKLRFIKFPNGGKPASYNDSSVFTFPLGTILIKNFYYPVDFRKPEKGRKILETRLLIHEATGWQAYPYIWNTEQTEAFYDPAGETTSVTYINSSGKRITAPYVIPNKNQCKGCHLQADKLVPIGTSARQLNREFNYTSGKMNQLTFWKHQSMLDTLPASAPKLAEWNNPETGNLNDRARAYLDANCGHCHSPRGPANTSGLYLNISEKSEAHLGVNKTPVAAGRGAGDLQFDIKPGEPQNSILIYRMKTNDPAIAMPEIGREQVHQEAVALLQEWISKNAFRNP
jgi:uncharacterized repeat protein (TIGR03806 family)